jgi:hypothetical protein
MASVIRKLVAITSVVGLSSVEKSVGVQRSMGPCPLASTALALGRRAAEAALQPWRGWRWSGEGDGKGERRKKQGVVGSGRARILKLGIPASKKIQYIAA